MGISYVFELYLGATCGIRTHDLIITNYLLYQLSYGGLLPVRVYFYSGEDYKGLKLNSQVF